MSMEFVLCRDDELHVSVISSDGLPLYPRPTGSIQLLGHRWKQGWPFRRGLEA